MLNGPLSNVAISPIVTTFFWTIYFEIIMNLLVAFQCALHFETLTTLPCRTNVFMIS